MEPAAPGGGAAAVTSVVIVPPRRSADRRRSSTSVMAANPARIAAITSGSVLPLAASVPIEEELVAAVSGPESVELPAEDAVAPFTA